MILLGPGEGEQIRPGYHIKVGREELVMTESVYTPGQRGPDPHVHRHHADAFFVLEGELLVELGTGERSLSAGDFALVPPHVVHGFRNAGAAPARFLNFHAPGMGFDDYVRGGDTDAFDQHDPPADGGRPASEVIVRRPGEGRALAFGPSRAVLKSEVSDALGSLTVIEHAVAPRFPGPVLHRHEAMVDGFFVLEGTLTVRLDESAAQVPAGGYACVPPGHAHTFSNPADEPVRMLNIMAPAGLERYLVELAALPGPPDQAVMAQLASKYDFKQFRHNMS